VNADRWRDVNSLFHAALEIDGAERESFLRDRAAADPELVSEVRSLLARHQPDTPFLEAPVWTVAASLMADDEPSRVGRQIGSYRILEEIGRGGMGVVYAARDERLGRTVALKALPPEYTRDRRHRDRLAREARAAAAFTHEAIATVFALEEIDGEIFIASELVPGETLRSELARGPVPPDRLIPTLVEIASGLAAAHARNVIHRDLKPENIIRRTDGHIKILDFGLARITDPDAGTITRLTEAGTAPGTPGYMAPEQLSGGDVDARTDLFAFGVVAWELATGQHPFGSNPALMLAHIMEGRPATQPRQLAVPALDPIIRRCLRVSPAERYASADELLADLRKLAAPSGSSYAVTGAVVVDSGLWWWQFHQGTMTVVDAATPVLAWLARPAPGQSFRTQLFLAVLALATAAVTLRMNLLFTSRVHPAMLQAHRTRLFRWIAGAEACVAALLLGSAAVVADSRPALAAVLVSLAIVMLASLAVIEPATASGASLER
jgi:Protein kinase domain